MATQHYQVLLVRDPEAGLWVTYVPALNLLSAKRHEPHRGTISARDDHLLTGYRLLDQLAEVPFGFLEIDLDHATPELAETR